MRSAAPVASAVPAGTAVVLRAGMVRVDMVPSAVLATAGALGPVRATARGPMDRGPAGGVLRAARPALGQVSCTFCRISKVVHCIDIFCRLDFRSLG